MSRRNLTVILLAFTALVGLTACEQVKKLYGRFQLPCTISVDQPARFFAIEAPETATAGAPFPLTAWVALVGDYDGYVEPLQPSFRAVVNETARSIRLEGSWRADVRNPEADCVMVAGMPSPKGASVSLAVTAPAGIYTLEIPEAVFDRQKPGNAPFPGAERPFGYPEPVATRSITIQ